MRSWPLSKSCGESTGGLHASRRGTLGHRSGLGAHLVAVLRSHAPRVRYPRMPAVYGARARTKRPWGWPAVRRRSLPTSLPRWRTALGRPRRCCGRRRGPRQQRQLRRGHPEGVRRHPRHRLETPAAVSEVARAARTVGALRRCQCHRDPAHPPRNCCWVRRRKNPCCLHARLGCMHLAAHIGMATRAQKKSHQNQQQLEHCGGRAHKRTWAS